jgi:2-polyprenyl-3-methyl-5-hydroxy-6-metoxy-1,4-benzoquinol methylase
MKLSHTGKKTLISKFEKYRSRNPIIQYLIGNFFNQIGGLLSNISFGSLLDVGCGDGVLLFKLQNYLEGKKGYGIDIDPIGIAMANHNNSFAQFAIASAHDLPFSDNQFDVVLCCEVLEHLDPSILYATLAEIRRVAARYCIFSVPREPIWCFLNLLRGAYITNLGNTPDHINHWNERSFQRMMSEYFTILQMIKPFPWLGVLCCLKNDF